MVDRDGCIALGFVAPVGRANELGVNLRLGLADCTARFESAHDQAVVSAHQPVPSGHRRTVSEEWSILNDPRAAIWVTNHDLKGRLRSATQ
jgi:hypothetical protein